MKGIIFGLHVGWSGAFLDGDSPRLVGVVVADMEPVAARGPLRNERRLVADLAERFADGVGDGLGVDGSVGVGLDDSGIVRLAEAGEAVEHGLVGHFGRDELDDSAPPRAAQKRQIRHRRAVLRDDDGRRARGAPLAAEAVLEGVDDDVDVRGPGLAPQRGYELRLVGQRPVVVVVRRIDAPVHVEHARPTERLAVACAGLEAAPRRRVDALPEVGPRLRAPPAAGVEVVVDAKLWTTKVSRGHRLRGARAQDAGPPVLRPV
mmetsp:Transcript_26232/g.88155  ORF Transcript_26232/g.88155 Transcript_26232/m.88155 type:complete len:262 (-) Transcript_26232:345-1130(-)